MREPKIIFIGKSMAGKTTLCQKLNGEELRYAKTQTVLLHRQSLIDTPGEYLERGQLWGALSVTAVDADIILLVQQACETGTMFPPGFASRFGKPCIGAVTKADMATEEQIAGAIAKLSAAGAGKIAVTSCRTGEGIEDLRHMLQLL